ncbi:MAG TPA: hypothetical protein VGU90_14175 [Terriglobales bacterium]|nr:hypothetical protein [Terriglobales bacterium]
MTNPISSTHANAVQNLQPARTPPAPQPTQKNTPHPQDTVTLKSSGDADRDGDNK